MEALEFAHTAEIGRSQLEGGEHKEPGESDEHSLQHGRSPFNIEGLVHGGVAADLRRSITPFGSGFRPAQGTPTASFHNHLEQTYAPPHKIKSMRSSLAKRTLSLLDNHEKNKARVLQRRQFNKTQDLLRGPG